MKTSKIVAIVIAVVLIVAGAIISCVALAMNDFDLRKFSMMKYETKTNEVSDNFSNIKIVDAEYDVIIAKSNDGGCKVVSRDSDKIKHDAQIEDDTLVVSRTDERKWYEHIGIFIGEKDLSVKVYLPEDSYEKLYALSVSGSVKVEAGFKFTEAEAQSTSGEVIFMSAADSLSLKSTSGDVDAKDFDVQSLKAVSVSGDIEIDNVNAESFSAKTTSGDIDLSSVVIDGDASINTTSGDFEFSRCDAANVKILTVSGDVRGSLLTDKRFTISTVSGDVKLPESVSDAGWCDIKTTSGDVKIAVE